MTSLGRDLDAFLDELRALLTTDADMVDEAAADLRQLDEQGDGNPDAALALAHIAAIVRQPLPLLERIEELQKLRAAKGRIRVRRDFLWPPAPRVSI